MKGSLIILLFFVGGIGCGLWQGEPEGWLLSDASFVALCLLMGCVGFSVGNRSETLRHFRQLNPRLALLPLATIVGTLAGCLVASLFVRHGVAESLSVGAGFGYYSLSSILITESHGAELGTVALLANIIRELYALLLTPLLVRWFGTLAPIAVGGATTADTTLPVIARYCGEALTPVSIYHGIAVDFSVPFLVTLFCSL